MICNFCQYFHCTHNDLKIKNQRNIITLNKRLSFEFFSWFINPFESNSAAEATLLNFTFLGFQCTARWGWLLLQLYKFSFIADEGNTQVFSKKKANFSLKKSCYCCWFYLGEFLFSIFDDLNQIFSSLYHACRRNKQALFRNKKFMFNEMTQMNAKNNSLILKYENPHVFVLSLSKLWLNLKGFTWSLHQA